MILELANGFFIIKISMLAYSIFLFLIIEQL